MKSHRTPPHVVSYKPPPTSDVQCVYRLPPECRELGSDASEKPQMDPAVVLLIPTTGKFRLCEEHGIEEGDLPRTR